MKRVALLIIALLVMAGPAAAAEVLVVQSVRSAMYDEALRGFRKSCPADTTTLVLSDYADPELARVIHEERPRLVLAVGDGALAALRRVRKTPVLALMGLNLSRQGDLPNVTGVERFVKPEQYLSFFAKIKARRVGVLYDPARTGAYIKEARAAAKQHGVELVLHEVKGPRQAVTQLASLKGVDALWLIPDATVLTRETLEACFLFGQVQSVPVVSFSAAHLKLGALAVLEADRFELGKQAGEMAQQLLRGVQPSELPVAAPRKVSLGSNEAVARRFKRCIDLTLRELP